jgi:hypothetical protein
MFDITSNELHLVALGSKMRLIPIWLLAVRHRAATLYK